MPTVDDIERSVFAAADHLLPGIPDLQISEDPVSSPSAHVDTARTQSRLLA